MKTTLRLAGLALGCMGVAVIVGPQTAAAQVESQQVFQLVQLDGEDLPAVIDHDDACHEELQTATLTLEPNGRWQLDMVENEVCGDMRREDQDDEDGRYEIDGNTIRFLDDDGDPPSPDDDPDIDVDELHTGTLSDQGLVVVLSDGETELMFQQQGGMAVDTPLMQ